MMHFLLIIVIEPRLINEYSDSDSNMIAIKTAITTIMIVIV